MKRGGVFLLLVLCANSLVFAASQIKVTMRNSGYTMGDLIHMRVEIAVPKASIDINSLPLEGRVTSWLDLRQLSVSGQNKATVLDVTWQLFGTVEYSQILKLPEIQIKTVGSHSTTIVVPAQSIYYSSVLPKTIEVEKLRPNLSPFYFNETKPKYFAICSIIFTLIIGFCWLWIKDQLPWLPYKLGPIATLARRYRKYQHIQLSSSQLCEIHQALNATAKQNLYPHTLNALFDVAPFLSEDKASISQFIEYVWQILYAKSPRVVSIDSVLPWLNRAAQAERLFLKSKK